MFTFTAEMTGQFQMVSGQSIPGATHEKTASTLEQCYLACLAESESQCAGFDFCEGGVSKWMGCWVHTESSMGGEMSASNFCDHYTRHALDNSGI